MIREFESYAEMVKAHQEDISKFPITYMFGRKSDEEIKEELKKIGATCMAECVSVMGCGDIMRRVDVPLWVKLCKVHSEERTFFMSNKKHLVDAIYSEMCNHEYSYTGDKEETLHALGKRCNDLENETFRKAWEEAEKKCFANDCF